MIFKPIKKEAGHLSQRARLLHLFFYLGGPTGKTGRRLFLRAAYCSRLMPIALLYSASEAFCWNQVCTKLLYD